MATPYRTMEERKVAAAKYREKQLRKRRRNEKIAAAMFTFWVLICLGVAAGIVFVVIHFIIRFWN